ncbi:hypothetical protein JY651_26275 [Pyxidicoccus parkwayensis]|uniref:Uncharacterized protein n=1 Tax=Pyxidicoccus parkwayensis TaxID=2813578 RepID=A0ABX7NJ28_9BACT|nr:hypothetical protein [Pyxidicoccus parkwaysis]QSQ18867.1 hypothetical protein JY651_26275 [Pyxidicoccus parkwaysis]
MRLTALLLGLFATLASAQQPATDSPLPPPPLTSSPTSPDEPEWATPGNFRPATEPAPSAASPAEPTDGAPTASPAEPPPSPSARPDAPSRSPAASAPRRPASALEPTREPAVSEPSRALVPAKRPLRYSRLSADSGGPTLVLTEAVGGMVLGAMLGDSYDDPNGRSDNAYMGAMLGALSLGTASTLYQYFVPVKRNESLLAASAATLGFTAGVSAANGWDLDSRQRALLALTTSQVGVASVLLLTAGGNDVSDGDAGLVGTTAFYAFITTGLVEFIGSRQSGDSFRFTPLLIAPAAGMLLGGLLAIPLEIEPSSLRDVTLFPVGMGLAALLVGSRLDVSDVTVAKTVLGTVAGTFAITVLLSALAPDGPTQREPRTVNALQPVPVPVVMPAGRGNDAVAAGPGVFMRF